MKSISSKEAPLLEILALLAPLSSKNTLRSWIAEGRVFVNNLPIKKAPTLVRPGDQIEVREKKKILRGGVEIFYEDDDLIVINKSSGLLSVSTAFEKGETAHAILKKNYLGKKVLVVHRLDQETSGLMVFAFNQTTLDYLKKLFEVHAIQRAYTAVVEGSLSKKSGTWESYLYEDSAYFVHETHNPEEGKYAITHYKVLSSSRFYSKLEVTLETGRKNQIRVHCQSAGHPIAGDKKYGAKRNPIKRLALHAHLLGFKHPTTKKIVKFELPAPDSFNI